MLSQTLPGSSTHPPGAVSCHEGPLVKCGFGVFSSVLRGRKQSPKPLLSNTAPLSESLPATPSRVRKKHTRGSVSTPGQKEKPDFSRLERLLPR